MKTQQAIEFYGGKKQLADALGVWPQVIYQWGDYPPVARQYELQVKTDGALVAESGAHING